MRYTCNKKLPFITLSEKMITKRSRILQSEEVTISITQNKGYPIGSLLHV